MIPTFILTGKLYEFMKWLVLIVLPAVSAAYFSLGELYEWPNTATVVGTLAIVTTFLGVVLGISTKNYNASDRPYNGEIIMEQNEETGNWLYRLELDGAPEEIQDMDSIAFKVVKDEIAT